MVAAMRFGRFVWDWLAEPKPKLVWTVPGGHQGERLAYRAGRETNRYGQHCYQLPAGRNLVTQAGKPVRKPFRRTLAG